MRFVRLVGTSTDTPLLIRRLADHQYYMKCCAAAVTAENNYQSPLFDLYRRLRTELRRQGIPWEHFIEKLRPAAVALGLYDAVPVRADYYKILGVHSDIDADGIKKAYRKKARQAHPDAHSGRHDRFLSIHEAYTVLSDPGRRNQYDDSRKRSGYSEWLEDPEAIVREPHIEGICQGVYRRYGYNLAIILLVLVAAAVVVDAVIQQGSLDEEFSLRVGKSVVTSAAPEKDKKDKKAVSDKMPVDEKPVKLEMEDVPLNMTGTPDEKSSLRVIRKRIEKPAPAVMAVIKTPPVSDGNSSETKRKEALPPEKKSFKKVEATDLTAVIISFLERYCRTYESKNIDRFMAFFAGDAEEKGRPIQEFATVYRKNFQRLDVIDYTIKLSGYTWDLDLGRIDLDGNFRLKWKEKGVDHWHEYKGDIQIGLIRKQSTFLIQELNYRFDQ